MPSTRLGLLAIGKPQSTQPPASTRRESEMPKDRTRQSPPRRATLALPLYAAALLTATVSVAGCVTAGPILAETGRCSEYVPNAWWLPIAAAELPDGNTVGDWIAFGDAQTAVVDKLTGRIGDIKHIVGECERRAAGAVKASRPKFLGVFR